PCGDGVINAGEECDGSNLAGATCTSLGYGSGTPGCSENCQLTTSECTGTHLLTYANVSNASLLSRPMVGVAWHPSGDFALAVSSTGDVFHYDAATQAATVTATVSGTPSAIAASADGTAFAIVGADGTDGALWPVTVDASHQLTFELQQTLSAPAYAIQTDPWTGTIAVVGRTSTYNTTWVDLWDPVQGVFDTKAFFAGAGVTGLMWADPLVAQGAHALLTTHGFNGADSRTWILDTDEVVTNNWSPGFGNAGGAGYRPSGGFGLVAGTSSNVVYVYSGTWTSASLPGVGSASNLYDVAWNGSGDRALLFGRAVGSPLQATVFILAQGASPSFDAGDLINASLANFDQSPYFGTSNTTLRDAAWRPNDACDGGLLVGGDTTRGWIIQFWDLDDDDC
ncbi:MAG: hypothetical protein ACPHRO_07510, partial [Nannocystaceae bacterium]